MHGDTIHGKTIRQERFSNLLTIVGRYLGWNVWVLINICCYDVMQMRMDLVEMVIAV